MSFSDPLVCSGISGRSSTISKLDDEGARQIPNEMIGRLLAQGDLRRLQRALHREEAGPRHWSGGVPQRAAAKR